MLTSYKEPTNRQRVIFAIFCVRAIPGRAMIPAWEAWADDYLAGKSQAAEADAAQEAAREAAQAVWMTAWDAALAGAQEEEKVAKSAAWAADAAQAVAKAAARVARAAGAACEWDKAKVARQIAVAADAAQYAARLDGPRATRVAKWLKDDRINFDELAKRAMEWLP